jgi:hypothetical protein
MEAARSALAEAPRSRISALPMPKAGARNDDHEDHLSDDAAGGVIVVPAVPVVSVDTESSARRQEDDS